MSKSDEKTFFDQDACDAPRDSIRQYYAIAKRSHREFDRMIRTASAGKDVLEYGCGYGNFCFTLAEAGGRITGIDISPKSIDVARKTSNERGFEGMTFEVMDAENMDFPDESFDTVVGSAILHHLDLTRCSAEIMRVIKPGGRALFLEPLGHNPALNLFRKLTPSLRTEDEHPLTRQDLKFLAKQMGHAQYRYYHVCTFFALPFLRAPFFWKLVDALDSCDQVLFKLVPPLQSWAWFVTMEFKKPLDHSSR
jgi:ubiquinone/menaquinone biosynthesis C-methylase UbiE